MQRFKNILVLCDDDTIAHSSFDRVSWLAQSNGAKVTLLDVIDAVPGELKRLFSSLTGATGVAVAELVLVARQERLRQLQDGLAERGTEAEAFVDTGKPFVEVIRRVLSDNHDLVIKVSRGSSAAPLLLSSDMHLLRKCPCPVWIINNRLEASARRILAAVDPHPESAQRDKLNHTILELATSLAAQDDARLDVVTTWSLPEEATLRHSLAKVPASDIEALLQRQQAQSARRFEALIDDFQAFSDRIRALHLKGLATELLPELVDNEEIDTLVMGTVGRTGIAGLLIGNTAETVLSRVSCSVLTVKPDGFVTPVSIE